MGPEQEQHPCRHRRSPRSPSCSGGRGGLAAPRPHIPSCSGGPRDRHRRRPLCSRSSHGGTTSSGGSRRRSSLGLEVAAVVASAQESPRICWSKWHILMYLFKSDPYLQPFHSVKFLLENDGLGSIASVAVRFAWGAAKETSSLVIGTDLCKR